MERFNTLEEATTYAAAEEAKAGRPWIPTDSGPHVHPRFSAIEVPRVGDEVSYTFNGDYYPDGTVTRVSKSLVITTSEGHRYYRKGASGTWKQTGGTWSLIRGHVSERNREF